MKHTHALFLAMAMALAGGYPAMPADPRFEPEPEPRPEPHRRRSSPPERRPSTVVCPRCHAEPGQPCDRRSLGRKPYHLAREQAVGRKP